MSWVEVDGSGWSWVEVGAGFSNTHIIAKFGSVNKVDYRGKTRYFINAFCLQKQDHVACLNKYTIVIVIKVHCICSPGIFSHSSICQYISVANDSNCAS